MAHQKIKLTEVPEGSRGRGPSQFYVDLVDAASKLKVGEALQVDLNDPQAPNAKAQSVVSTLSTRIAAAELPNTRAITRRPDPTSDPVVYIVREPAS